VRLRTIAQACVGGLVVAALLHSQALMFASLAASALAALVVASRRRVFAAFSYERAPAQRVASWGSELEIIVSVTNDKLLPLVWLRVRDRWPSSLEPLGFTLWPPTPHGSRAFVQTVSLRWYERLQRRYRVRCTARGLYRFGPVELEAGDPFGIAGVGRELAAAEQIAVLPKVLRVPAFEQLIGHPLMEETVAHSLAHDPTALRGIRPYRPGDAMRAINWRATARTGELQTNEFDPTSLAAVRLLLDVRSLQKAWEGIDPDLMELLCVVTASLASAFAEHGFGVGLASNAQSTQDWGAVDIPAEQGALPEVLEALAKMRSFSARDFGHVLAGELSDETSRADCVIVTAALRPGERAAVARLAEERPTRVVHVGRPHPDEASMVDFVVPRDFDWRASDALPFLA